MMNMSMDDADNIGNNDFENESEEEDEAEFEAKRAKDAENKVIQDIFGGKVIDYNKENELNLMIIGEADNVLSSTQRKFHKECQTDDNMVNQGTQTAISLVSTKFDRLFDSNEIIEDFAKELDFKKKLMTRLASQDIFEKDLEDSNAGTWKEKLNQIVADFSSFEYNTAEQAIVSKNNQKMTARQLSLELECPIFDNQGPAELMPPTTLKPTVSMPSDSATPKRNQLMDLIAAETEYLGPAMSDETFMYKSNKSALLSPQRSMCMEGMQAFQSPLDIPARKEMDDNTLSAASIDKGTRFFKQDTLNLEGFGDKEMSRIELKVISPFPARSTNDMPSLIRFSEPDSDTNCRDAVPPSDQQKASAGFTITVHQTEPINHVNENYLGVNRDNNSRNLEGGSGEIKIVTFGNPEHMTGDLRKNESLRVVNDKGKERRDQFKIYVTKTSDLHTIAPQVPETMKVLQIGGNHVQHQEENPVPVEDCNQKPGKMSESSEFQLQPQNLMIQEGNGARSVQGSDNKGAVNLNLLQQLTLR